MHFTLDGKGVSVYALRTKDKIFTENSIAEISSERKVVYPGNFRSLAR